MNPALSRREFIAAAAVTTATGLLSACRTLPTVEPAGPPQSPVAPSQQQDFTEPEILASSNGLLEVTLVAAPLLVATNGPDRYGYGYNGEGPGPTLRLRPGDRLIIHLENQLPEATNLHTHGLHVSPTGDGDNVFVTIEPGDTKTYSYDIPDDHRSGLFWYHPHHHGSVARQVAAGLSGAIIVDDELDAQPDFEASTERTWILTDPPIGSDEQVLQADPMEQMFGRQGDVVLVNGMDQPRLDLTAGTVERWRIVNASSSRYYDLALDDHEMYIYGSDGGRLAEPLKVDHVLLAPGERTEVVVLPSSAGQYSLRAQEYDRGTVAMGAMMSRSGSGSTAEAVVATIGVAEPGPAATPPQLSGVVADIPGEPASTRTLELGMGMDGGMMGGGSMMSFTIDGRVFDPDRTDVSVRSGTVERWTIVNTTDMDHPFHLHVWPFIVEGNNAEPGWKDTVNVRANDSVNIVIPFTGFTGRTVYHCHILDHEDLGMMGVIEVNP